MAKNQSDRINVRELREKHNLSQKDLADATGIPKGRINGWEQMGSHPKVKDTATLKQFFDKLENKNINGSLHKEGSSIEEENKLLRQQLADKEEIISLLKDKIKLLEK